ncbi:MAG: [protein-PII] uridylyltransferase [Candidatus Poribacteria bacterium]|nr:[protein-PII] uridylyltransferase [Candidatus Poribacteria bacterium]
MSSTSKLVSEIQSFCRQEYDRISQRHRFGISGREIVQEYTRLADNVIHRIIRQAEQEGILSGGYPLAILALGGYGRAELSRHSDIDIMLVYNRRGDWTQLEAFASQLITVLWDTGFDVGHSCRSIHECVQVTQDDLFSKTSMLEARYVTGDMQVYRQYQRVTSKPLFKRQVGRFISQKIQDWNDRHKAYGSTIYLQEPNIKESVGGLRDFHTAIWISAVRYGLTKIDELYQRQIIPLAVYEPTVEAIDFMLRLRNELHLLNRQQRDVLSFEIQENVAKDLGYQDNETFWAEEQMLRNYYLHAENIFEFAKLIIDQANYGRPQLLPTLNLFQHQKLEDGFQVVRNEIVFQKGQECFAANPARIIKLFVHHQQTNYQVGAKVRHTITANLDKIDDNFRHSPEIAADFLSILRASANVAQTLRRMHRWKVLESYLPEFSHLRSQFQLDGFHQYTVDEHTFYAIENLELETLTQIKDGQVFIQILNELERPELLRLAMLLHDIGKGVESFGNHHQKSVSLAKAILARLGIRGKDRKLVLSLIREHLTMSYISRHRDLDDDKVIQTFAQMFDGNASQLKMLYLLTYADIRAVNDVIWNDWHATLLWELYRRALTVVERKDILVKLSDLKAEVIKRLGQQVSVDAIEDHFDSAQALSVYQPEVVCQQIQLVEQYQQFDSAQSIAFSCLEFGEQHTRIGICTQDSRGLFRQITGVLTAQGINILSADIETRDDGIVIDMLTITETESENNTQQSVPLERCNQLAETLTQIWGTEKSLDAWLAKARNISLNQLCLSERIKPQIHQTEIQVNNDDSDQATILEIRTRDRVGLLFSITDAFYQLGLDLRLAKIFTQPTVAIDSFYVTEQDGSKILSGVRIEEIKQVLEEQLRY